MSRSPFTLAKWYLDCVTERGTAFLAYAASLRWKLLTIHYASILVCDEAGRVHSRTSLKNQPLPALEGSDLLWSSHVLEIDARWHPLSAPVERRLLSTPDGAINWSCLQPRAEVEIRVGNDPAIHGLGYAERIDMTLDPRELPMDQLKWGRYLSPSDALVWIEWSGATRCAVTLLNGIEVDGCTIAKDELLLDHGRQRLSLAQHTVLRDGVLASTALSMIPGIEMIAPRKILHARECKWRSRGRLMEGQALMSSGWTIHEVVDFGEPS